MLSTAKQCIQTTSFPTRVRTLSSMTYLRNKRSLSFYSQLTTTVLVKEFNHGTNSNLNSSSSLYSNNRSLARHISTLPTKNTRSFSTTSITSSSTNTTPLKVDPITRLVGDGTLSHVIGQSTPALTNLTIGDALDDTSSKFPHKTALSIDHQGVSWTWRQLRVKEKE